MAVGWSGADPTEDPDTGDYELGVEMVANAPVTITHVRVFGTPNAIALSGRQGKIWDTTTGLVIGTASMPNGLLAGWNSYALTVPVERQAGQRWLVSYGSGGKYGFIASALGSNVVSGDGAVTFLSHGNSTAGNGRINSTPGNYPTSATPGTFWGVDVQYSLGTGNTPPVITNLALSASGLTVSAAMSVTDAEGLTSAVYSLDWGDGSTSSASSASHTYASAGVKAVLAGVVDSGGLYDFYAGAINLTAPASAGLLIPTTELVAVAWLKLMVPYLGNRVATELPQDNSSWSASGFTVVSATGGSPHPELEVARPVVTVDTYAVSPSGGRPPWNLANQQAEQIKHQAQLRSLTAGQAAYVTLPAAYRSARVFGVRALTEPRRVPGDQGNYARYTQDLEVWWT